MTARNAGEDVTGHLQQPPESKPNPDPTEYTNDAIERAITALRDHVNGEIKTLVQRFDSADTLFAIRINNIKELLAQAESMRIEQKKDATTGLAAALSAQKELAAAENTSNKLAISKSEQATAETIKTNQEANNARIDALIKSLDEVKLTVTRLETTKQAVSDTKTEQRAQGSYTMAIISSIVGLILFILGIVGTYALTQDKPVVEPIVITTK